MYIHVLYNIDRCRAPVKNTGGPRVHTVYYENFIKKFSRARGKRDQTECGRTSVAPCFETTAAAAAAITTSIHIAKLNRQ